MRLTETPPEVFTVNASGEDFAFLAPLGDGWYRIFVWNRSMYLPEDTEVTLDPVREIAHRILGSYFGMHDPRWISRFHNDERQVPQYWKGRVFLAGDAGRYQPRLEDAPRGSAGVIAGRRT
jgi:2-polyprenyl-6-methoxyphenol hydroxylase-like FAD-dependent oxidoreductase